MTIRSFKEIRAKDFDVSKLQDSIREFVSNLTHSVDILNGNLVQDIQCVVSQNVDISHGLNRPYRGYIVTRVRNDVVSNLKEEVSPNSSRVLRISTGADNPLIDLWIF